MTTLQLQGPRLRPKETGCNIGINNWWIILIFLCLMLKDAVMSGSGHSAVRVRGNQVVIFGGLHDKKFLHDLIVLDIGMILVLFLVMLDLIALVGLCTVLHVTC